MSYEVDADRRKLLMAGLTASIGMLSGCNSDGGDGAEGEQVEWTFYAPEYNFYEGYARSVVNQLGDNLGLQADLVTFSWSTYLDQMFGGTLDYEEAGLYPYGSNPDRLEPEFYLSMFTSDNPLNPGPYENETYDELFEEYSTTFDEERRTELQQEMQNIIAEDAPFIIGSFGELTTPINTDLWSFEETDYMGVSIYAKKSIIDAEPRTDETTLVIGAVENEQVYPNHMAMLSSNFFMWSNVWDTLGILGYDGDFENWSLESTERIDDTTIDMTLREGMVFHDGTSVTAEDLKFTLDTLREYSFPDQDPYTSDIEATTIETDLTVRLEFDVPTPGILTAGSLNISILPEHIWQAATESGDEPIDYTLDEDELIGHGPWQVDSWDDQRVEWSVFDEHWHDVAYDRVIYLNHPSIEQLRVNMENGDVHRGFTFLEANVLNEFEQFDHIEIQSETGVGWTGFALDYDHPPNDDPTFRRALYKAIDWQEVIDVNIDGWATPSDRTPIVPTNPNRPDLPLVTEQFDPEEARSMLEEEGYAWDEDDNLHLPAE